VHVRVQFTQNAIRVVCYFN